MTVFVITENSRICEDMFYHQPFYLEIDDAIEELKKMIKNDYSLNYTNKQISLIKWENEYSIYEIISVEVI